MQAMRQNWTMSLSMFATSSTWRWNGFAVADFSSRLACNVLLEFSEEADEKID
jgi:hypothetical protein